MLHLLTATLAAAEGIEDYFPTVPAGQEVLVARAVEVLGPPARMYDAQTATPAAATVLEREVETRVFPASQDRAPDSLRCWGRYMLALSTVGPVPLNLATFGAEHCGLPLVPGVEQFFVAAPDAEEIVGLLAGAVSDAENLQAQAVVLAEAEDGSMLGLLVGMYGAARFQPFPRVWEVGDAPSVPGTPLQRDRTYALFVAGPGKEVASYPLPATDGVFDVNIPVAATPGAWRVTMNGAKRDHFADSSFFFTLYVGEEPPRAPTPLAPAPASTDRDAVVLSLMNEERARFGLSPLEPVGRPGQIATLLESLPKGEVARVRALRQWSRTDPLPDVPHGAWDGVSGGAQSPVEAAWLITHHPVTRLALMDPAAKLALVGSQSVEGGTSYLGLVFRGPPSVDDVRSTAVGAIQARVPAARQRGPGLEAELDPIAEKVARGELSPEAGMKQVRKVVVAAQKARTIEGAVTMNLYAIQVSGEPTVVDPTAPADVGALAVGAAIGTLGRSNGIAQGIAIVVLAASIR